MKSIPKGQNRGFTDRVFHQTMSIVTPEPSHRPQTWAIFRSPSINQQSYRKSLIQSSCLPLRLVFDLARHQTCPFRIVSRTDQRSIVLCLHLEGLLAYAIHDDLVAALGPKAMAYNTVTRHLTFMRPSSAPPKLLSTLNQVYLTPTIPTGRSQQP
jgi:hypothetical protein